MKLLYTLLFLFFCLLFSLEAPAQKIYHQQIVLDDVLCEQEGEQLRVNIFFNTSALKLASHELLVLTPVVQSGDSVKLFSPVVIAGKNRYKTNQRAQYFHKKMVYSDSYIYAKIGDETLSSFNYVQAQTFEVWMKEAKLVIKQEVYACADCKESEYYDTLQPVELEKSSTVLVKPEVKLGSGRTITKTEKIQSHTLEGQAYLEYPVNQTDVYPNFHNNAKELHKLMEAIDRIRSNGNIQVNSIVLTGYASPDGKYKSNQYLSEERAKGLKKYLQQQYHYPDSLFKVTAIAEDWEGLRTLVNSSEFKEKETILTIIDKKMDYDKKEDLLKRIKGGTVYKDLLHQYYPLLRHVDYKIQYTINKRSEEINVIENNK